MDKSIKPLGRKAYGSIPHLPGSRVGPGDHHIHEGQARICMEQARDKHDRIIITEKLDGSNVAIANIDGNILALNRSGYLAATSPYEQHHFFARWVSRNYKRLCPMVEPGEVLHGEWLAQAHGTIYHLPHAPFVAFDLTKNGKRRPWDELIARCWKFSIVTPQIIHDGAARHLKDIRPDLELSGHGAQDPVEGAVWRVERKGEFDFMAKWVRPDKVDGKYLETISGKPPIWHWRP